MKMLKPTCSHCIYWQPEHAADTATVGHCHRFPPAIFANPGTGTIVQKFPTTDRHQWCGEWSGDDARWAAALAKLTGDHAK